MSRPRRFLALDVGERRIGVAAGDSAVRVAVPLDTVDVDGNELQRIAQIILTEGADTLVIGYPRNQSGEPTAQTAFVEAFVATLKDIAPQIVYQDESLTSVLAEQRLKDYKKPYTKADVDAQAAAIILQDYMETRV